MLFRVMYVVFIPMGLQDTLEGERREVSDNYLGKANQKPVMNLLCRNPVFLWNIYGTLANRRHVRATKQSHHCFGSWSV